MHLRRSLGWFLVMAWLPAAEIAAPGPEGSPSPYELPRDWPSSAFFPETQLSGKNWKIDATVFNGGFFNTWGISSDIGPFQITGDARLWELVHEIEATVQLQEASRGGEFAKGLGDAGKARLDSIVQVASDPVGTVKKLPQGASQFLGKVGNTLKHTVQGTLDIDPNMTPEDAARKLMGVEKAKRLIAAGLGVNPYSRNPALQQALDQAATARALGSVTADAGTMIFVPATIGHVLTGVSVASQLTKQQVASDPKDLAAANRARALAAGIPPASFDALNSNPLYDPWTLTVIWNILAGLPSAKATGVFVDCAAGATDELQAFAFLQAARIMAKENARVGIREILPLSRGVACARPDGSLFIPAWLDYEIWTPEAEAAACEIQALALSRKSPGVTVITTGGFSPYATERLAAMGIQTQPKTHPD